MCRLSLRRWGAYSAPPDSLASLRVGPGVAEGEMGGEEKREKKGGEGRKGMRVEAGFSDGLTPLIAAHIGQIPSR